MKGHRCGVDRARAGDQLHRSLASTLGFSSGSTSECRVGSNQSGRNRPARRRAHGRLTRPVKMRELPGLARSLRTGREIGARIFQATSESRMFSFDFCQCRCPIGSRQRLEGNIPNFFRRVHPLRARSRPPRAVGRVVTMRPRRSKGVSATL
jgi:hypothetical protein